MSQIFTVSQAAKIIMDYGPLSMDTARPLAYSKGFKNGSIRSSREKHSTLERCYWTHYLIERYST